MSYLPFSADESDIVSYIKECFNLTASVTTVPVGNVFCLHITLPAAATDQDVEQLQAILWDQGYTFELRREEAS